MRSALWLLATLLLVGCGGRDEPAPRQPFQLEGVSFALTPSAARDCEPETVYQAEVSWRVDRPGRQRLEVRIGTADGALFARSNEAEGRATTGPWVSRGMWFLLVDREKGTVLAAQRAGPEHCD